MRNNKKLNSKLVNVNKLILSSKEKRGANKKSDCLNGLDFDNFTYNYEDKNYKVKMKKTSTIDNDIVFNTKSGYISIINKNPSQNFTSFYDASRFLTENRLVKTDFITSKNKNQYLSDYLDIDLNNYTISIKEDAYIELKSETIKLLESYCKSYLFDILPNRLTSLNRQTALLVSEKDKMLLSTINAKQFKMFISKLEQLD